MKLIDVTLRDGGHRTNFHFSDIALKRILRSLDSAGVDCIEVGYRNGILGATETLGRAGRCDNDYLHLCRTLIRHAEMSVMAHPALINESDLLALKQCGVDLIRLCVVKGQLANVLPYVDLCRKFHLKVSVNFIHISQYSSDEIDQAIKTVSAHQPEIIYFADSNGALLSHQVTALFRSYLDLREIQFGFHPHDQLGLAQTNALAAFKLRVPYIDASLLGMGKGTGNLKLEFFVAYLKALKIARYDLATLIDASNYVREHLGVGQTPLLPSEFIRGIRDLSTAQMKQLANENANLNHLLKIDSCDET